MHVVCKTLSYRTDAGFDLNCTLFIVAKLGSLGFVWHFLSISCLVLANRLLVLLVCAYCFHFKRKIAVSVSG